MGANISKFFLWLFKKDHWHKWETVSIDEDLEIFQCQVPNCNAVEHLLHRGG